jgi:hypothetical protein
MYKPLRLGVLLRRLQINYLGEMLANPIWLAGIYKQRTISNYDKHLKN